MASVNSLGISLAFELLFSLFLRRLDLSFEMLRENICFLYFLAQSHFLYRCLLVEWHV